MTYSELLRPQVHFSPRKNWMNDPNGCVFFNGSYHLYFQYHPFSSQWGPMHWGHAVSKDLIHWEEHDIALFPDERLGMAFSGSVVIDEKDASGFFDGGRGLVAFYTTHLPGDSEDSWLQQQSIAWSQDGNTWVPYHGNPVIPNPGLRDFRDPKVIYHTGSASWVMILVSGTEVRFYTSADLINWTEVSVFGSGFGLQDGPWECPDLFPMKTPEGDEVWILAVSYLSDRTSNYSPIQYFIGDFDGREFLPRESRSKTRLLDYGQDLYATQSWYGIPEEDGRRIWIGWANHWCYANDIPTEPWRGVLSFPRRVSFGRRNGELVLKQYPVAEADQLMNSPAVDPSEIPEGSALDVRCLLNLGKSGEVEIIFQFGLKGRLSIRFQPGEILLDRSTVDAGRFSEKFVPRLTGPLPESDSIDIRIIIDRSLVEIFVCEGEIVLTSQIFPDSSLDGLDVRREGGSKVTHLEVRPLSSIWNLQKKRELR